VCSSIGIEFIHSIDDVFLFEKKRERLDDILSHRIHININTEMKEIKDPREDTIFQEVNASG